MRHLIGAVPAVDAVAVKIHRELPFWHGYRRRIGIALVAWVGGATLIRAVNHIEIPMPHGRGRGGGGGRSVKKLDAISTEMIKYARVGNRRCRVMDVRVDLGDETGSDSRIHIETVGVGVVDHLHSHASDQR